MARRWSYCLQALSATLKAASVPPEACPVNWKMMVGAAKLTGKQDARRPARTKYHRSISDQCPGVQCRRRCHCDKTVRAFFKINCGGANATVLLREIEKHFTLNAFAAEGGKVMGASPRLGIHRRRLYASPCDDQRRNMGMAQSRPGKLETESESADRDRRVPHT